MPCQALDDESLTSRCLAGRTVPRPPRRGRPQTPPVSSLASTYTRAGLPVFQGSKLVHCNRHLDRASEMRDLEEFRGGAAASAASHGSDGGAAGAVSWWSGDPEAKRRRRVAGYKAYAVEARVKASLRKGVRWIKDRCTGLVRRW
ncbi:hypothetical protein ACP70R_024146 [Stipagrostis hirtigluma subsp. patula]